MQLSNYRTATKLVGAFVLVALIGAAMGAISILNMKRLADADSRLYEQQLIGVSLVKEANIKRLQGVVALRDAVIATSGKERDDALKRLKEARTSTAQLLRQAEELMHKDEAAEQQLAELRKAVDADSSATEALIEQISVSDLVTSTQALRQMKEDQVPQSIKLGAAMSQMSSLTEQHAGQVAQSNGELYASSRNLTLLLVLVGAVVGVVLGLAISRHVTRPLAKAVAAAQRMAEGDMSEALKVHGRDEVAQLLRALEAMRAHLQKLVAQVRENSETVATASVEIAHGNADLSQRTEEQASALQQTAATMEQLGVTVTHNADSAQQANQLALGASQVAQRGGEVVADVVRTMRDINQSSQRIADIIGVIDGIAFQTNILALNAAVEAARAGEQGRGFAVVASEVRSLAQRSAAAAREIKELISSSVERVEQGSSLVDEAGRTMDEVVTAIRRVTDIVGEISEASREQSSGVAQVGDAIAQMDKVTQQNAALVEQSAASAESLKQRAEQLVRTVAVFRLAEA